MKTIEITQSEILMATRPNVFRNRKKYNRFLWMNKKKGEIPKGPTTKK